MAAFDVVLSWSSGNVLFQTSTGGDICYVDGDSIRLVACGSLVASSSFSVTGGQTVAGSLVASSSFAATGNATISGSLIASSSASVAGAQTVSGSLIASSSASVAGAQTVSGSLIASSSAAITGNATISASLLASSSAAISGNVTVTKKVVGSSDASIAGTLTMGSTATLTIPINVFNCPEIRGRSDYNFTAAGSTDGGGVVLSATNPLNVDLWVERVYINVQTASSSSAYWYCGTANTASSSQTTLWPTGINCSTAGLAGNSTEVSAPIIWESSGYFTGCVGSCSDGSAGLVGTVSVFYILPVTT